MASSVTAGILGAPYKTGKNGGGTIMKRIVKLTDIELKVMKVLWESEEHLMITEVAQHLVEENISSGSVAQAMKNLLAKNMVVVCESVPVANVYARTFAPAVGRSEFMALEYQRMKNLIFGSKKFGIGSFVANLIDNDEKLDEEDIEELQEIVEETSKKLKKEK